MLPYFLITIDEIEWAIFIILRLVENVFIRPPSNANSVIYYSSHLLSYYFSCLICACSTMQRLRGQIAFQLFRLTIFLSVKHFITAFLLCFALLLHHPLQLSVIVFDYGCEALF